MSNKKYRSKIIDRREFPRTIETTVNFRASTLTGQLDVPDMHNLFNRLTEDYPDAMIMVRAMNGHRQFTFKGYHDIALNVVDFEEYFTRTPLERLQNLKSLIILKYRSRGTKLKKIKKRKNPTNLKI